MTKLLNCLLLTLVGLLLLLPDKSHGEAGGDLNLTNKASLSSRSGYNFTLDFIGAL